MAAATSGELEAFRRRARHWLASRPGLLDRDPDAGGERGRSADEIDPTTLARGRAFQLELYNAGFAGISWPMVGGGQGLNGTYESVWRQEVSSYELPTHMFNVGLGMCGPTIVRHGSPEQQRRFLPSMLRGETIWCQLFSEPGAGSDLASVSSKASFEDGRWVLNGQKVWTSGGRIADFGLALMRTDSSAPKHQGMTTFIVDMKAAGVTVRPLRQMTGRSKFDEVFLDDVVVPDDQRIGAPGEGWHCARTTLSSERGAVGRNTAQRGGSFNMLRDAAVKAGRADEPLTHQELAVIYTYERIGGWFAARAREALNADRPDNTGMLAKLNASGQIRRTSRLAVELIGPQSVAWLPTDDDGDEWSLRLCAAPGLSIGGGTDEIIRNTIGEVILGLPREPRGNGA